MKKIIKYIVCLLAPSAILLSACTKSFLDDPKPTTTVLPEAVFLSDANVRAFFNGIYSTLRSQWMPSPDSYGIIGVNLGREVKGIDVALGSTASSVFNPYAEDYAHNFRTATFRRPTFNWNFFYSLVNSANVLIAGVNKSASLAPTSKAQFEAEARAFRAWCYFELVRDFSRSYREGPDNPGVPIYTEPTTAATVGKPRAKLSEVFTLIMADLEYAVNNIPTTRANGGLKNIINKDVAKGLQARVFLEVGMADPAYLSKAITAAQEARASYPLNAAELAGTMTADFATKKEVLWGFPQSADQTVYYGTISTYFGYTGIGPFNFSIDTNFVKVYAATDIRATKFYAPGGSFTGITKWKTLKFGPTTNFTDYIVMMRTPELYLIEAEARARLNDLTAGDVLFAVQKDRDPSATKSGQTGNALILEILLEKRKELFGEIGIGYLDMKRAGLDLVRDDGHPLPARFTIPANSPRFTLQIPQSEFDANRSLKPSDQNE